MKTIQSIFPKGILTAILASGAPFVIAQTVDTSTGTVLDSTTSRTVIPPENPAPTKLTASILPIGKDSTTSGDMTFFMTGSAVSVAGRITGMEPNKRYQAVIRFPATPAVLNQAGTVVNPSSEARPPAAESPPTGSPAPATPTAKQGAGAANRPPDATTVTTSGPQSIELDLGTMVSDAAGAANLNSTIQNKDLTPPPTGILGCSAIIKRAPPLDSIDERNPVAAGVITAPAAVVPVPPGP